MTLPAAPGRPTYFVNHMTRTITVTTPPVPGPGILEYQITREYYANGSWNDLTYTTANSSREIRFSPGSGSPMKRFEFRSRARSAAGWGPFSRAVDYFLVWRPYELGVPQVTQDPSTKRITVTVPEANASGSTITSYQIRRRQDTGSGLGNWVVYSVNKDTRTYSFVPTTPLTRFDFQARASTDAGWSDWGLAYASIGAAGSGPLINVSGVYKKSTAFVKVSGVWLPVTVWGKRNGVWRKGVR